MQEFRMPALGADMEKGQLVQWRVAPGARVKPGDVVAVVETQKGAIDVEIFLDGYLERLVPEGTELPVGGVLAWVREEGEQPAAEPSLPQAAPGAAGGQPSAPVERERVPAPAAAPTPAATRVNASPAARRRATELGIDVAAVHGTGPEGSVTLADVEGAAGAAQPQPRAAPVPARGFDVEQMRAAIASAMSRSKREIPHYYLAQAVDFAAAERWLADYNAERAPADRLLAAALLLKASAVALKAVPQLNGFHRDGAVQLSNAIHIGWAVNLRGGGLVVPAMHDVDRKSLPGVMEALRDLVQRARTGGLRSSEFTDGTVTATSLGDRGADSVYGVIYPPQLAVIGFGRVAARPWVVDGQVVARPVLQVTLAGDHRASDGHVGAQFLGALDAALQQPGKL